MATAVLLSHIILSVRLSVRSSVHFTRGQVISTRRLVKRMRCHYRSWASDCS